MRNVAASYLLCSCRANAVQQSGNPAAAALPSNALVCSFPTHPTLRYSAGAPWPCLPLLLPASLPSPARLHNVCAPRATPRKPALARAPLPHASTPRPVALAPRRPPPPPSTRMPAHFSSALGCHIILASAPLRRSPRTSGPRPIPRAQFPSLAPHARALQLGPRVPNHPRPGPPPCTPTHLRASAHPARTFSLRRRRCRQKQCEP